MLKRIHVEDLTLGMYLHEFCGSWMEHPFWRTRFLLEDPKDLERIYSTAVQEVWIDVSRGKDVAAGKPALSPEEVEERIATDFSALDAMPPLHVVSPELPPRPQRGQSLGQQRQKAPPVWQAENRVAVFRRETEVLLVLDGGCRHQPAETPT